MNMWLFTSALAGAATLLMGLAELWCRRQKEMEQQYKEHMRNLYMQEFIRLIEHEVENIVHQLARVYTLDCEIADIRFTQMEYEDYLDVTFDFTGGFHCRFSIMNHLVRQSGYDFQRDDFRRILIAIFQAHRARVRHDRDAEQMATEVARREFDEAMRRANPPFIVPPGGLTLCNGDTLDVTYEVCERPPQRNLTAREVAQRGAELAGEYRRQFEATFREPNQFIRPRRREELPINVAYTRAKELLLEHLNEVQRNQFKQAGCFLVVGSSSKRTYKIVQRQSFNIIDVVTEEKYCFAPSGDLEIFDIMLAQKIVLETDEEAAMKVANRANADGAVLQRADVYCNGNNGNAGGAGGTCCDTGGPGWNGG
jgi:hypothetical protein